MADSKGIPGYMLLASIYASPTLGVWHARRESDALPVILKVARGQQISMQEIVRLRREYEVARELRVEAVVRPLEFLEFEDGCALVQEETDGISLWSAIRDGAIGVERGLKIAAELAGLLGRIHACNVVHKDIRPNNVILQQDGEAIRITGFGISSVVLKNAQDTAAVQRPEATLAYISPEQTGRMNCRLDWRSDLYSLGVTLYELFTGKLPFPAEDPLALVYAHIAKSPPAPAEINTALPPMIGAIIGRLMAKSPDERYQSAVGVQQDLELCLDHYRATSAVPEFPLGRYDVSDKFHIPRKLYGREKEVARLLGAFAGVAAGQSKMVSISGYSGIGKSSLVHELERPIIGQNGKFITGKFDQFNRNIPYSSLIGAFRELVRQVLTEPDEQVALLKEKLARALGENAQVIINVIPELAAIIGEQPVVPELHAAESQSRFTALFRKFVQALTAGGRPLCIFLDDLQWADPPSLKLVVDIMSDGETRHVLLLVAYRDNEVEPDHILAQTLRIAADKGVNAEALFLSPLGESDVCILLQEAFHCSRERALPLARICLEKTGGNPFFLSQFLRRLYEDELIVFGHGAGEWRWDAQTIIRRDITDNVVNLMVEKIQLLTGRGKQILQLAACMGDGYSLETLADLMGKPAETMHGEMEEIVREGLVVPSRSAMRGGLASPDHETVEYRFLHDRVRQAAYSLLDEQAKSAAHHRIGNMLLEKVTPAEWRKSIFDIVTHLNKGLALANSQAERGELAHLNLEAGRKARDSGALDAAYRYFAAVESCLPEGAWAIAYALMMDFHLEKAEVAYLCGKYEEAYALCDTALLHARDVLDRARVCEARILVCRSEGKNLEAVRCALDMLAEMGKSFPEKVQKRHVLAPLLKVRWLLRGRTDAELLSLPGLKDPRQQAILRIMVKAGSSAYITDPLLVALWILAQMEITLKYGQTTSTGYIYASYGLLLSGAARDYAGGNRFAGLARGLVRQNSLLEAKGKALLISGLFAQPWRVEPAETASTIWEAYEHALAEGDPEFAAISLYSANQTLPWFFGENLPASIGKIEKYSPALKKLQQDRVNQWSAVYRQAVWNCINPDIRNLSDLNGEYADERVLLGKFETGGDRVGMALFYVTKLILCTIFREFDQAEAYVQAADDNSQSMIGQLSGRQYHLYSCLALFARFEALAAPARRKVMQRARASIEILRKMESGASSISHHAPRLLEAELMRIKGSQARAADLYDEAIHHARACRHLYEEALANELCGRFYHGCGKPQIAEGYLQRAYLVYRNWGATAKLMWMHEHYDGIAFPRLDPTQREGIRGEAQAQPQGVFAANLHTSASARPDSYYDLEAVLKATRAISGEIIRARLLEELLKIVLENAGAQRGVLLLEEQGALKIEGEIEENRIAVLQSKPFEGYAAIPRAIINYVVRTKNSMVLDDAAREGSFGQDAYLATGRVRSLLCMPLMNQGVVVGLLYLENNAAPGVFTLERLEILKAIAAQITISIENARLYEKIEKKVEERTRQLQEKTELLNKVNREMAHEIEQRKLLEQTLRKLATTDSLTGLLVRRRFLELGEAELHRAQRMRTALSLLVLDIDHFKSINDTYGHLVGDEVLKHFSALLSGSLRSIDIVCRFGGEEFIALLPGTEERMAMEIAQRLCGEVASSPLKIEGGQVEYTVSIGIAGLQEADAKMNEIVTRADEALYQAKKTGRNRAVHASALPGSAQESASPA